MASIKLFSHYHTHPVNLDTSCLKPQNQFPTQQMHLTYAFLFPFSVSEGFPSVPSLTHFFHTFLLPSYCTVHALLYTPLSYPGAPPPVSLHPWHHGREMEGGDVND